jgi:hypothetical protein
MKVSRWVGRAVGLDVHRDFCEVAICEDARRASFAWVAKRLMPAIYPTTCAPVIGPFPSSRRRRARRSGIWM